jgi:hypothetical protein
MVTHYEPARLRRNRDQPTAITGVLVATAASSYRTGDIPLGTLTSSARSRQGFWALYPNGAEVVVVHPGGALAGAPADVAGELRRLGGNGQDELGRSAARGIGVPDRPRCRRQPSVAGDLVQDLVEPGRGLPAQRPRQPARRRLPAAVQLARCTGTSATATGRVTHWRPVPPHTTRPQPSASTTTSRLTAHGPEPRPRTSHPDGSPAPVMWGDLRLYIVAALAVDR